MAPTMIPDEDVIAALRAVVARRGRHAAYPDTWRDEDGLCVYSLENGQPACIVGAAFDRLGLLDLLVGRRGPISEIDVPVSSRALTALQAAQDAQDTGITWGWVLDHAERAYRDAPTQRTA